MNFFIAQLWMPELPSLFSLHPSLLLYLDTKRCSIMNNKRAIPTFVSFWFISFSTDRLLKTSPYLHMKPNREPCDNSNDWDDWDNWDNWDDWDLKWFEMICYFLLLSATFCYFLLLPVCYFLLLFVAYQKL